MENEPMVLDNESNTVYIGKKNAMNYVLVITTIFNKGSPTCTIKARGRAISKAVDVAEITMRRFLSEAVELKQVNIDSEEITNEKGTTRSVSTIELVLGKKDDDSIPKSPLVEFDDYEQSDENTLFIGKKNATAYTLVCVTIFNKGLDTCVIRARGRSISRAVDVAEIVRKKFLTNAVDIAGIKIGSEEVEGQNGTRTVSTIDIVLKKKS